MTAPADRSADPHAGDDHPVSIYAAAVLTVDDRVRAAVDQATAMLAASRRRPA